MQSMQQAAICKCDREGWKYCVVTQDEFPFFVDLDPSDSDWFVGCDKKALKLISEFGSGDCCMIEVLDLTS